jgi:hypothetical protein
MHEPVLERPSRNKKRTKFPSTTPRVVRMYVAPKGVTTSVASTTQTTTTMLAPVNTNLTNNATTPLLVSALPTNLPVSTRSVDLTYRSRLVTGTVPSSPVVPNSTSSLDLSSTPFPLTTNPGPEGKVEETEASLHLGDASVGSVVVAAVLGTLAILGALVGLGFWAWNVRGRMAAGATVSC